MNQVVNDENVKKLHISDTANINYRYSLILNTRQKQGKLTDIVLKRLERILTKLLRARAQQTAMIIEPTNYRDNSMVVA